MTSSLRRPLIAIAAALCATSAAHAQTQAAAPETGATFQCQDGTKMVLNFDKATDGIDAIIWLHGASYRLPNQPPRQGPVQVVWSDGEHSLTWSPGVQLMWMASDTHLMCGRSGHKH